MAETRCASVVISVLNEGDRLVDTVESILAARAVPREIIVVDDGSTDGCSDALLGQRWRDGGVRVFRRDHAGIAPARNFGAIAACERVLVFLDAHCSVDATWLDPLLEILDRDQSAIAVPTIASTTAPDERGCGARIVNDLFAYRWVAPPASATSEVGVAPGGCFALARETFLDIGCLGALSDFGFEDVEFSIRAWRFGLPIIGTSKSVVRHDFRRSSPYPRNNKSWLANIILTALLHLDSEDQRRTLEAAAGYSAFAGSMIDVLGTEWRHRRDWIDARTVRDMASYWARFPMVAQRTG
jgi:glycosyltransferase involved in cell wall biosynthesis